MNIKIFITKISDPSYTQELDFKKFPIAIGRDEKNDVILHDPFKTLFKPGIKLK